MITLRHAIAMLAVAVLLAPAGASAAPVNDDFANRLTIQPNTPDSRTNAGATTEAAEPMTSADTAGCTADGQHDASGNKMDSTLWWDFTGDGGPMTVSTLGSDFDTILAVYQSSDRSFVACNDDIQPYDAARPNLEYRLSSEVLVNTVAGRHYAVQVGGCTPKPPCAYATTTGTVQLRVSNTPPGDARADALPLTTGVARVASTRGATTESGEVLDCPLADRRDSPYAKTIWFVWHAPAIGTAVFSASGFDTVMTVYRADSGGTVGCNDDSVSGSNGASRLPAELPAGSPVQVSPGDYLVQVGGYHDAGFDQVAARDGVATVEVDFTENLDVDGDGVTRDRDCNDRDPSIHPGAAEIPNNDVDENCDGIVAYDRDGDGVLAPPAGPDCDDGNAAIHPGATDVPGNGVDENCDGADTPQLDRDHDGAIDAPLGNDCNPADPAIHPGAHDIPGDGIDQNCDGHDARLPELGVGWHMTWQIIGPVTVVTSLTAQHVGAGTKITIVCRGRGRGCPRHAVHRVFRRAASAVSLLDLLRGHRRLRAGAVLELRATRPGWVGVVRDYTIRRGKDPATHNLCLDPKAGRKRC